MKTSDKLKTIFIIILFWTITNSAQQQQHISWPSLADSPWPVLRGDMQATGRSKYVGPRTNNELWVKDFPLGILYGPVIGYDNNLYFGERALSPQSVNYFYSVDKDGNVLWTFETNSNFPNNSGPVLKSDSSIYFFSRNENMYALGRNGNEQWRLNLWANLWPFYVVDKIGNLYVAIVDTLIVVSPAGEIINRIFVSNISPPMAFSIGGDTLFFYTGGTNLLPGALIASDINGNIYWSYDFEILNWGIPLIDNANNIYVFGSDSQSTSYLNRIKSNGELDWRYQVIAFQDYAAPTIDRNGNIIFNARKIINGEEKNCIISLDYYGNENWVTTFEDDWTDHYINHGLVCDAEGKIYCGSSYGGYFYCFDNNGDLLWKYELGELEYDSCPAISSDGTLYIGTHISSLFQNHQKNLIAIRDTVVSVDYEENSIKTFKLEQNYPNPFNSTTNIRYSILQSGRVTLTIYDLMGSEVAKLLDRYQESGSYDVIFQPNDLASGIYFYTLTSGDYMATKKLILLK